MIQVRQGVHRCDIVCKPGVHDHTVRCAIERGGSSSPLRRRHGSLLDPHLETVDRPKRALLPGRASVRFETEPGRKLQSGWGVQPTRIAGVETDVHFIVNTLAFSRRFHFWNTDREDAEHTYEGIIRSFEWFGGVTGEVLVDDQNSAVLEHPREGETRFNTRCLDLAGHCGFAPRACRPARARTNGRDELMVDYIKHHFFPHYREFESWDHLNGLAEQWLREEADVRVHGTAHEVVAQRFAREAPALKPLPACRYDTAYWELRQVGWDAYIDVRGNRYSVPGTLTGHRVSIRISLDDVLSVFDGKELVARHRLQPRTRGWVTVPEHHAAFWKQILDVQLRPLAVYEEESRRS